MNYRTDLAVESEEYLKSEDLTGVDKREKRTEKTRVTEIKISTDTAAKRIGKPKGRYVTLELSEFATDSEILDDRLESLKKELSALLPEGDGAVLAVGIGNESITPDALGPEFVKSVFSTRHIDRRLASEIGFESLHPVCALATGVLGQTGIETGEIIKSVVDSVKPKAVITVDALACASIKRLGKTVQLTDTGITPGSGVGNSRKELSERTLGVPVIAIGVPTVVDAATLADGKADTENMMVTPREIDVIIHRAARLIGLAVNCALQPEIEPEILLSIV